MLFFGPDCTKARSVPELRSLYKTCAWQIMLLPSGLRCKVFRHPTRLAWKISPAPSGGRGRAILARGSAASQSVPDLRRQGAGLGLAETGSGVQTSRFPKKCRFFLHLALGAIPRLSFDSFLHSGAKIAFFLGRGSGRMTSGRSPSSPPPARATAMTFLSGVPDPMTRANDFLAV